MTAAPRQELILPVPPSANRYWRVWRGRTVKSHEARAYSGKVWALGKQAGAQRLATAKVVVSLTWVRKERRGDLDNRIKVALDALKGVAFTDDRQVVELHARLEDGEKDRFTVEWWAA